MSLTVATNLRPATPAPAALTNALRDIKPPIEIPSGWAWALWVLGGLLLAALLYWAWRLWRKRRRAAASLPGIPPHVVARQKLAEALALLGQPREFCILVSDTVRWYLEERFDFHAPERTTEEFLYELRATDLLTPDQKESLGQFLQRCDLVKFARYEPREPELRELHAAALRLVEETEPIAASAPGAAQPAGTGTASEPPSPPAAELAPTQAPTPEGASPAPPAAPLATPSAAPPATRHLSTR